MSSTLATDRHRAITRKFIDQNPSVISVRRRTTASDGTGGFTTTYVDVPGALEARRVLRNVQVSGQRMSESGLTVIPQWTMIFMADEDVQLFDKFDLNGKVCEVVWLSDSPPWRLQAEVYEYA